MKWTKKKPTKEGWYWHCYDNYDEPTLALIFKACRRDSLEETLYLIRAGWARKRVEILEDMGGWFYGTEPLAEPEGLFEAD